MRLSIQEHTMTKTPHKSGNIKPSIAEAIEQGDDPNVETLKEDTPISGGFGGYGQGGYGQGRMPGGVQEQPTDWTPPVPEQRPADLFSDYSGPMDFGDAIRCMERGQRVQRAGWNGKNMWIALQASDEHSKMTLPYIFMKTAQDDLVPWLASQSDMLAKDWRIVG
jgi:Protein of unknown function (DUF2829)